MVREMTRTIAGQATRGRIAALAMSCALVATTAPAQFTGVVNEGEFGNVQYWVGHGANSAAVVIDFHDGKVAHSYGWGLRWDGVIDGVDALRSIVQADPRMHWNTQEFAFGLAVFGMYLDANGNGGGFTFTGSDGGSVDDPADHLQNGFMSEGFWSYFTTEETPATHSWDESMVGAGGRLLSDGSWDGWAFAPGYVSNAPRNPIVWMQPPRPHLESLTLRDFTTTAPEGFTSQQVVTVEYVGVYGDFLRMSETSGGGDWMFLDGEPITFTLSPGDGLKTVYATLRLGNELSDEVSTTITLAAGATDAEIALPMKNPTSSNYLIYDVTYAQPPAQDLAPSDVSLVGSLAASATVDMIAKNGVVFRVIARLANESGDGTLAVTVPLFDGGGNPVTTTTSASYSVQTETSSHAWGDYNRDGVINVEDVTALANDIVNSAQ